MRDGARNDNRKDEYVHEFDEPGANDLVQIHLVAYASRGVRCDIL